MPGDRIEAEPLGEKDQFARARLIKVVEPGPGRIPPPCPYHFVPGKLDYCGGCDWQQADYPLQLRLKRDVVVDCMRRLAKLPDTPVLDTLASPQPWRYRNKVQVPFQPGTSSLSPGGGEGQSPSSSVRVRGNIRAGFYVPGSHKIIEFDDCLVQPELSVGIVKTVRELAAQFKWPAYEEDGGRGWLRHLYIRTNSHNEALVVFVTRTSEFPRSREGVTELIKRHPQIKSVWQNVQPEKTSIILGEHWRKIWGRDRMSETIGKLTLEFLPGAFLQVNTGAAEVLYRTAEAFLLEGGFKPNLLLDVYSGVGAIALWLAPKVQRVIGVEEFAPAVKDGYHNARRLKVKNVHFVLGQAERALKTMRGMEGPRPWAAVLDPPRSGCEAPVLQFLIARKIERVIYVSCNPSTFARDAAILAKSGYKLTKVQPVDLFPQTSHVELVGIFNL